MCVHPEIPDLTDAQLKALHQVGHVILDSLTGETLREVDPRISIGIVMAHLAKINETLTSERGAAVGMGLERASTGTVDAIARRTAEDLVIAADHNVRMHVRYLRPGSKAPGFDFIGAFFGQLTAPRANGNQTAQPAGAVNNNEPMPAA